MSTTRVWTLTDCVDTLTSARGTAAVMGVTQVRGFLETIHLRGSCLDADFFKRASRRLPRTRELGGRTGGFGPDNLHMMET